MVTVADREADIYDFLALKRRENSELLIRAYHNRCVQNRDRLSWIAKLGGFLGRKGDGEPGVKTKKARLTTLA